MPEITDEIVNSSFDDAFELLFARANTRELLKSLCLVWFSLGVQWSAERTTKALGEPKDNS